VGTRVSPSTMSDLNKKIYGTIEAWRNRPDRGRSHVCLSRWHSAQAQLGRRGPLGEDAVAANAAPEPRRKGLLVGKAAGVHQTKFRLEKLGVAAAETECHQRSGIFENRGADGQRELVGILVRQTKMCRELARLGEKRSERLGAEGLKFVHVTKRWQKTHNNDRGAGALILSQTSASKLQATTSSCGHWAVVTLIVLVSEVSVVLHFTNHARPRRAGLALRDFS
jgi:hypothetical protein